MNYTILGRETSLCRAEIESVATEFSHLDTNISLFTPPVDFNFSTLGGSLAYGEVLAKILTSQNKLEAAIIEEILDHFGKGENKLTFGISNYLPANVFNRQRLRRLEISIKQTIRESGRPVRFVSPKVGGRLSAAEVIYNKLTSQNGCELVLFKSKSAVVLGRTLQVQDINAYSLRDHDKPCRDMKVGMLPPKLAQIMLNLAGPKVGQIVFDPFCGSGVVLIEAMLCNLASVGSDINPRMVACAEQNLAWAKVKLGSQANYDITEADATKLDHIPVNSTVVTETYLGQPMSQFPNPSKLMTNQKETAQICLGFLRQLSRLTKPGYRTIVCLPFWHNGTKNHTLGIIDQIRALGYTISRFRTSAEEELLYRRPNQVVGRQVLVLTRD